MGSYHGMVSVLRIQKTGYNKTGVADLRISISNTLYTKSNLFDRAKPSLAASLSLTDIGLLLNPGSLMMTVI